MSKDKISKEIESKFGNRLRIRVNGILIEENKILLVKHRMSSERGFWSTPGGGMEFGSTAQKNLAREFYEETELTIAVGNFICLNEYLAPPLHALECFFEVKRISGDPSLGSDPELTPENQLLSEIKWMSLEELHSIGHQHIHPIFIGIKSLNELVLCKGYFNFENKYLK
uniref:NUDIX domain-containing protein n=1 Tax=Algoriphagus sp. TaxID=1872435 RepID=UPI004048CD31